MYVKMQRIKGNCSDSSGLSPWRGVVVVGMRSARGLVQGWGLFVPLPPPAPVLLPPLAPVLLFLSSLQPWPHGSRASPASSRCPWPCFICASQRGKRRAPAARIWLRAVPLRPGRLLPRAGGAKLPLSSCSLPDSSQGKQGKGGGRGSLLLLQTAGILGALLQAPWGCRGPRQPSCGWMEGLNPALGVSPSHSKIFGGEQGSASTRAAFPARSHWYGWGQQPWSTWAPRDLPKGSPCGDRRALLYGDTMGSCA